MHNTRAARAASLARRPNRQRRGLRLRQESLIQSKGCECRRHRTTRVDRNSVRAADMNRDRSRNRLLVHIGYPKAASSWLQKHIFSGLDATFAPFGGPTPEGSVYAYTKAGSEILFDVPDKGYRTAGQFVSPFSFDAKNRGDLIQSQLATDGRVTCLSNEAWAGHPFSGGVLGPIFAARIHQCAPEAKILVVTRNQPEMILSSYFHYLVKRQMACSLQEFMRPRKWIAESGFSPYYFDYSALIAHYDALFGEANVICIPFEIVKVSPRRFAEPIYRAFDAQAPSRLDSLGPENVRSIREAVALSRAPWTNRLHGNQWRRATPALHWLGKGLQWLLTGVVSEPAAKRQANALTDWIRAEVGDFYCAGNAWLARRMGVDLESLGYKVRKAAPPETAG
jgi:hypothetical protein